MRVNTPKELLANADDVYLFPESLGLFDAAPFPGEALVATRLPIERGGTWFGAGNLVARLVAELRRAWA